MVPKAQVVHLFGSPPETRWHQAQPAHCLVRGGTQPMTFPKWLTVIMEAVMPQCGLLDPASWPTCCNLNYYLTPHDTVGPHADDEPLFEGKQRNITIMSLSLGGTRRFSIYRDRRDLIASVLLRNGDLLVMELRTQSLLKHGLDKLPNNTGEDAQRINLTWRWLSAHRPGCPALQGPVSISPPQLPLDSPPLDLVAESDAVGAAHRA